MSTNMLASCCSALVPRHHALIFVVGTSFPQTHSVAVAAATTCLLLRPLLERVAAVLIIVVPEVGRSL